MNCGCTFTQADIRIGKDGPRVWAKSTCMHGTTIEPIIAPFLAYLRLYLMMWEDKRESGGDVQA